MATAVFLTYNTVGRNGSFPNGKLEQNGNTAIIVQHPKGMRWGATVNGQIPVGERQSVAEAESEEEAQIMLDAGSAREKLISDLYSGILTQETLTGTDFVVVYVGAAGSEGAIRLAANAGERKARLVLCDCNLECKLCTIAYAFGQNVPYLLCECGGHATMELLVREFLLTGNVGPKPLVRAN